MEIARGGEPHLRGAANAAFLAARLADPNGKWGTPVSSAREIPVDQVLQPVAHAPVSDVLWVPADGVIVVQQAALDRRRADEPRIERVVQECRVAAPAEWIRVSDALRAIQHPLLAQIVDDLRIRVLHGHAGIPSLPVEEAAVEPNDVTDRDTQSLAQLEVGDAICGRGVHDAGTLIHAHQLRRGNDDKGQPVGDHVGEQRLVRVVDKIRAAHLLQHLVAGVENRQALLGQDVALTALTHPHIGLVRVHRQRHVSWKRPRSRGPR